jgi:hypothetical protein
MRKRRNVMKRVLTLALAVGLCLAFSGVQALAEDWTPLGERILNYRSPEDYITVKNEGSYKQIKLQVKSTSLEIMTVKVAFTDGTSFDATLDKFIGPGGFTKEIEFPAAKSIEKVTFTYKKVSGNTQLPTVRLLGTM